MAKAIKWTPRSLRTYVSIVRHLDEHWTQREVDQFDSEVDAVLELIAMFPRIYRRGEGSGIREAFIKPCNLLIYRVGKDQAELLTFWDARRDPRAKPRFSKHTRTRRGLGSGS